MVAERSVKVVIKGDVSNFNRAMLAASAGASGLAHDLSGTDDHFKRLIETGLALGPALVPITTAAIPAVAGLSNELGIAAAGAAVAGLAFHGIGDALTAMNNYAVDPTAAHLKKLNITMNALGPAGREFVDFLQSVRPELQKLQNLAGAGFFPGLEAGLTQLAGLEPHVNSIITKLSGALGDLSSEAGVNLSGPRFEEFFNFLERTARPTLIELGRTIGNFALAFANLWRSFEPLSTQFSASFLQMSQDFAEWTDGLSATEGFQDFLAYIERVSPKVGDTLGAIGDALVALVRAAAPVGEVSLPVITALAKVFTAIANTPIGSALLGAATAMAAFSRAAHLAQSVNGSQLGGLFGRSAYGGIRQSMKDLPQATRAYLNYGDALDSVAVREAKSAQGRERLRASFKAYGTAAIGVAALGTMVTGLDEKFGLTNTATLAMAGSLAGPWGAAVLGGIGLALDLAAANDDVGDAIKRADAAANDSSRSIADRIAAVDAEIAAIERRKAKKREELAASGAFIGASPDEQKNIDNLNGDSDKEAAALKHLRGTKKTLVAAGQEQVFAENGVADAMRFSSQATRNATQAILENIAAKNQAADASLNAFDAETNYRSALKAAKKQADSNNAGIKGNSEAALANRGALSQLAAGWNRLADAGGKTMAQQRRAKADFVAVAVAMGVPRAEAKRLADAYFHIPKKVNTNVYLSGVEGAVQKINNISQRLKSLDGTTAQTFVQLKESVGATGGLVTRAGVAAPGFDTGGYVRGPGTTTSDSIPVWLSDQEYVIRASSVAKYGKTMMDQINAGRFASGGQVQRFASDSQGAGINLSASLVGAKLELGTDGFATFVKGQIIVHDQAKTRQQRPMSLGA